MSLSYKAVQWNRNKRLYHRYLWASILLMILVFIALQLVMRPNITLETLLIRTSSLVAISLLHFILLIGPLCRLDKRFLPLLYNRRHLGVTMFFFAAIHGVVSLFQFHALGNKGIIESLFTANLKYNQVGAFPFQVLGFFALIILFLMAITSHDFWLKNLGPKVWKSLHMCVYIAYGLVVLHVVLGILQFNTNPIYWTLLVVGFVSISLTHIIAGIKSLRQVRCDKKRIEKGYHFICYNNKIDEGKGITVCVENRNIALFKHEKNIYAVDSICRHQMGPLGEGRIIDGCITCPWHGYQYLPHNGESPPPFTEKLATYEVKVINQKIWLNPTPITEGTPI